MHFNVHQINLENLKLTQKDLLKVKHSNGVTEFVPMYYLDLVAEYLKYLICLINGEEFIGSLDFSQENLKNFLDL